MEEIGLPVIHEEEEENDKRDNAENSIKESLGFEKFKKSGSINDDEDNRSESSSKRSLSMSQIHTSLQNRKSELYDREDSN